MNQATFGQIVHMATGGTVTEWLGLPDVDILIDPAMAEGHIKFEYAEDK